LDTPIETGDVRIHCMGVDIPAYQALPDAQGPFPIVLIAPEIYGVNENIRDICRRFALEGYYAIAPDLFIRQGDVSKLTDHDEIRKIVNSVPDAQASADLEAAADFAASGKGNIRRLYLTGFCWGGRIAWLHAAWSGRLSAAVAWYGKLAGDTGEIHPSYPIHVVPDLECPVLGLYGGMDQSIPVATVDIMLDAIRKHHKNSDVHVYPQAGHGFFADYRSSYNAEAAQDGWRRTLQWFREGAPLALHG
jgi:carboxymethylenebutenolidase